MPASDPGKPRVAAGIVLVLTIVVLPLLLLSAAGDAVPPSLSRILSLAILPAAALTSWLVMRAEGTGFAGLGLGRPKHWGRSLGLGLLAGIVMLLLARIVTLPLVTAVFGSYLDPAMFDPLRGNVGALLVNVLLVSWLHAALCEEIISRGFLLQRFELLFGGGAWALGVAVVLQGVLFGLAHYPQGATGVASTALGGILWGAIFLFVRRNLWVVVIGHAVMDTTVFVLVFLGLHRLVLPG
jgi:membrane protease YdiL (CAAX protease family)